MFFLGFEKIAKLSEDDKDALKKGALIGTGAGAIKNIAHNALLERREKKAPSETNIHKMIKHLKPGDIIVSGTNTRLGESYVALDLPESVHEAAKKLGLKDHSKIVSLPNTLNAVGAGSKYHASIYVGNGRVAHMYPFQGAHKAHLTEVLPGENAAAYRLKGGIKGRNKQVRSAVNFANAMTKKKTPYKSLPGQVTEFLRNVAVPSIPGGVKPSRCHKKGLVCHSLPVAAYNKQRWSHGVNTFSGDIRRNMNFEPVLRKDNVKIPAALKVRGVAGQAMKGLKYALPGAGLSYALHKYKRHQEKK